MVPGPVAATTPVAPHTHAVPARRLDDMVVPILIADGLDAAARAELLPALTELGGDPMSVRELRVVLAEEGITAELIDEALPLVRSSPPLSLSP